MIATKIDHAYSCGPRPQSQRETPPPLMKLPSDPFLRGYLTAAFWTNDDKAPSGDYRTSGRPEEMMKRLTKRSLKFASDTCAEFQERMAGSLPLAYEHCDYGPEEAGHDFWLTRNGHGSGFWDRELTNSDDLTSCAHTFGECHLTSYKGRLYFE